MKFYSKSSKCTSHYLLYCKYRIEDKENEIKDLRATVNKGKLVLRNNAAANSGMQIFIDSLYFHKMTR